MKKIIMLLFPIFICIYFISSNINNNKFNDPGLFTISSFIELSKKSMGENNYRYTNESFKLPDNLSINSKLDKQTMAYILFQIINNSQELKNKCFPISRKIEQEESIFWTRLFKNRMPSEQDDYVNRELLLKIQEAKKIKIILENYADGSSKFVFVWNDTDTPIDESRFLYIFKDFDVIKNEFKHAVQVICDLGIMDGTCCTDSYAVKFDPEMNIDYQLAKDALNKLINAGKRRVFDSISINFDEGDEFDYKQRDERGACKTLLRISNLPALVIARELENKLAMEDRVVLASGLNNVSFYLWYNSQNLGMINLPLDYKSKLPVELFLIYHNSINEDVNSKLRVFSYILPVNYRNDFVAFCMKSLTDKIQQNTTVFGEVQVCIQDIGDNTYMINFI